MSIGSGFIIGWNSFSFPRRQRAQGFVTSTPLPDGRIIYIVVEGDNCGQVALLHGITVAQLRQFNTRLDENCTLAVGQQLVVGVVSSNVPTAGPAPTIPSHRYNDAGQRHHGSLRAAFQRSERGCFATGE